MVVLLQGISDYVFSSALGEFYFTTDAASANFRLMKGSVVILDENYVPDEKGQIVVYDLQQLIEPYLHTNLIESFSYTITDAYGSSQGGSFTAQYCAAESSLSARSFMERYFLSSLMGDDKVTAPGRKEVVHLVTTQACTVKAVCTYWKDGELTVGSETVKEVTELNKVVTVDVSPSLFEVPDSQLVKYEIQAGSRRQSFLVESESPDVAPALLFTNSFGCQETFYCTGTQELDPQFSRSASLIGGKYRNYLIEENRVFSANTGILNVPMSMWADDLFRSREVYLMENNIVGKEITILESESKRTNDYDAMYSYNFKYPGTG